MARDGTKSGGRPKGSLNRKTLDLHARCVEAGVDPFQVLLELCKSDDEKTRLSAAGDVCGYLYAKKRSIDVKLDAEAELIELATSIKQADDAKLNKMAK